MLSEMCKFVINSRTILLSPTEQMFLNTKQISFLMLISSSTSMEDNFVMSSLRNITCLTWELVPPQILEIIQQAYRLIVFF